MLQSVTGYYRVGGVIPQQEDLSPQQALDHVVQQTPHELASVVRPDGRLVRRPIEAIPCSPSRFNIGIAACDVWFCAWIDPTSLNTHNAATVAAQLAAGTPRWDCDVMVRARIVWRGMLTHTQLVSLAAVMEALQDLPQEAERYLRSVVMV